MNNAPFDGDRPNIALLSAMSARYTLTELYLAYETGQVITVYWYPEGKARPAHCGLVASPETTNMKGIEQ